MTKVGPTTYVHPVTENAKDDAMAAMYYDAMLHKPLSAFVQLAYVHFKHETITQYLNILAGDIWPIWHGGDHEFTASADMFKVLDAGGDLYTRHTFMAGDDADMLPNHPMKEEVNPYLGEAGRRSQPLMLNDVFRFVHDINGHWGSPAAKHFSFGPNGERNAWLRHRNMYSREALPALWCETRGQSAWTNAYADHADKPLSERPFAQQKCGTPPTWMV